MKHLNILIIGGGIGGLTSAIALAKYGQRLTIIEKDPTWSVYGVGIIQQGNVIRAMTQLGLIDDYLSAGFGFDQVEIFIPTGACVAKVPSPRLVEGLPANVGIGRRALHEVLGRRAKEAGADIRLGVTAESLHDDGAGVDVTFSDGQTGRYDIVIGADGLYSTTRAMVLPDAPAPAFTGQSVWRYNFKRPDDVVSLCAYEGPIGVGLVPLSDALMYMFVTTPEPGNPRYPTEGLAEAMCGKLTRVAPQIAALANDITEDSEVVYRPLETVFVEGAWHAGRMVLLGDAIHATTPHLGQGAGMAIEDAIVLAEELDRHASPDEAFTAYRARRFERCKYIVDASVAICRGQLGQGPLVELGKATGEMFGIVAQPI
jgi:2-polyprenyl-6-methoxyphenol hydroxylase-like FAD-dependent oxidoreductase